MRKLSTILLTLFIGSLTFCCMQCKNSAPMTFDSIQIALYLDNAVWPNCKVFTENKLKAIGLPYHIINQDTILKGDLDQYSVLFMPGGRPDLYERNLGQAGLKTIQNYVSRGGGYIGICGGAYLAARTNVWRGWAGEPRTVHRYQGRMGIFKGIADGPIEDFAPTYQDFNCGVNIIKPDHPVTNGLPETFSYLYDHGPALITADDPEAIEIGKSVKGDHILIMVTQYHHGRVFLTSGHPEVINSQVCRDLIKNAILWCSKQSSEG